MARGYDTYYVSAKVPGGSFRGLGTESATSKAGAIRQFRSGGGFPRGTKFKAQSTGRDYGGTFRRNSAKRPRKGTPSKRIGAALSGWLKKQNPAFRKAKSVRVKRLKGGAIKFTPEK